MNTPSVKLWVKGTLVMLASYNFIWGLLLYIYPDAYLTWVGTNGAGATESAVNIGVFYLVQAAFFTALPIFLSRHIAWLLAAFLIKVGSIAASLYALHEMAIGKKLYFQVVSNDVFCLLLILFVVFEFYSSPSNKK